MKVNKYIFFILTSLVTFTASLSGADNREKLNPSSSLLTQQENDWIALVKEIDNQRFVLEFPKRPTLKHLGERSFEFSTFYRGVTYVLYVHPIGENSGVENWIQQELVEFIKDPSIEITNFSVDRVQSGTYLEMYYKKDRETIRERKFLHKGYAISLISRGDFPGEEAFFQSFQVFSLEE